MTWRHGAIRLLALAVLLVGCGLRLPRPAGEQEPAPDERTNPPSRRGEGPGGRPQKLALSPEEELKVGRQAYKEVLNSKEFQGKVLPADTPQPLRARRIVDRLARATRIKPLQREINLKMGGYTFEWEASVVREKQINAFCLPAGKLVLFTGILQVTRDDDAYLATVLSHEMAHALAHHASERVARERGGLNILGKLRYQRTEESEADHIGVFLMAFAGYDSTKAVAFWQQMEQATGARGGPPEFLSDHPSHETRIRQLRKWSLDARKAKKAFDEGRIAPAAR
jgi:metalloendopeptidase OMA1, mitochondrial